MVPVVHRGRADDRHHLPLDVGRSVSDQVIDQIQPVVDFFVVVSLGQVVVEAPTLAAGEELRARSENKTKKKKNAEGEQVNTTGSILIGARRSVTNMIVSATDERTARRRDLTKQRVRDNTHHGRYRTKTQRSCLSPPPLPPYSSELVVPLAGSLGTHSTGLLLGYIYELPANSPRRASGSPRRCPRI